MKVPKELEQAFQALTPVRQRFVIEYLVDYNGTAAAVRAGYSQKVAHVVASRNLKLPVVQRLIAAVQRDDQRSPQLRRKHVLQHLSDSLNRNLADLCDEQGFVLTNPRLWPPHVHKYVEGMDVHQELDEDGRVVGQKIRLKLSNLAAVLDMAMRYKGLYAPDKSEVKVAKVQLPWSELLRTPRPNGKPHAEQQP